MIHSQRGKRGHYNIHAVKIGEQLDSLAGYRIDTEPTTPEGDDHMVDAIDSDEGQVDPVASTETGPEAEPQEMYNPDFPSPDDTADSGQRERRVLVGSLLVVALLSVVSLIIWSAWGAFHNAPESSTTVSPSTTPTATPAANVPPTSTPDGATALAESAFPGFAKPADPAKVSMALVKQHRDSYTKRGAMGMAWAIYDLNRDLFATYEDSWYALDWEAGHEVILSDGSSSHLIHVKSYIYVTNSGPSRHNPDAYVSGPFYYEPGMAYLSWSPNNPYIRDGAKVESGDGFKWNCLNVTAARHGKVVGEKVASKDEPCEPGHPEEPEEPCKPPHRPPHKPPCPPKPPTTKAPRNSSPGTTPWHPGNPSTPPPAENRSPATVAYKPGNVEAVEAARGQGPASTGSAGDGIGQGTTPEGTSSGNGATLLDTPGTAVDNTPPPVSTDPAGSPNPPPPPN